MAELHDLAVGTTTKINSDTVVVGNIKADTFNNKTFLTASAAVTPSTSGTNIVTENYLYWAFQGRT